MRKLRIGEKNSNDQTIVHDADAVTDRKLRVVDSELLRKADRLLDLKSQQSSMKREMKVVETEIGQLQSELLAYGQQHNLDTITSDSAVVVFNTAVERKIDPKTFLTFLQMHGRTKDFYDFVNVPITAAIRSFGEAVLETSGVLVSSTREYAGLKVSARK